MEKSRPLSERYRETLDHRLSAAQQEEYDSLLSRGRTFYDHLRWYSGVGHGEAFNDAADLHGTKDDLLKY